MGGKQLLTLRILWEMRYVHTAFSTKQKLEIMIFPIPSLGASPSPPVHSHMGAAAAAAAERRRHNLESLKGGGFAARRRGFMTPVSTDEEDEEERGGKCAFRLANLAERKKEALNTLASYFRTYVRKKIISLSL